MHLTLFLGAGFSAAFGHPVMDGFLGFADSCKRLSEEDRSFLGTLILEARGANSFLESSPTNLEDILSFSEMGERLGLTKDGENRNHRLREIVRKIYTTAPPSERYWERYEILKKLVGPELRKCKSGLSFVTTNYDLNIESACFFLGTQVNPGFELHRVDQKRKVQVIMNCYDPRGIPLYKLHGSVNWYPTDGEPGLVVEDRVVPVSSLSGGDRQHSLPYPCVDKYETPGVPLIVPPSFLKPDLSKALKAVWSGAAQTLAKANVIVFVGYSFPSSDTEMMYFLARALSENAGLRAVYLVDPKADAIVARLRGPGSRMGSHFRDFLQPINSKWTDIHEPPWMKSWIRESAD